MIMAGKNIRQFNDPLQKVKVQQLFHGVVHPKPAVLQQIEQLRIVRTINQDQYRKLKIGLPYVTCGIFNPRVRKTENFGYAEYFILDIDHLHEKGFDLDSLREKLKKDDRIVLLFASPGNDGLKVFFKLKEKCYDPKKYSIFYKVFAQAFSQEYQLEQVIDSRTSDVTRACFVSHDAAAYFNNNPQVIDIQAFVDFSKPAEVHDLEKTWSQEKPKPDFEKPDNVLTDDLLDEIKLKLNPKIKLRPKRAVFVPEILNKITELVTEEVNKYQISVKDIKNIQYGKQFTFSIDELRWAEINIFYGKKGFSVVKSTKSGSNEKLADIVHQVLINLFFELPEKFYHHE